jgi:NAD(P)-dependent dehydrogenase (short-subunit alcohol dehydrogenase family)
MTDAPENPPGIALVTGASAGIGRAAAIEIARREMSVLVTYRSRPQEAEETVSAIRALGARALALRLDLGDTSTFPAFVSGVRSTIGSEWGAETITALVNNGGFGGGVSFESMTEADFDRYYRVLLKGPYFLTQRMLPLIADGGAVVSVASSSVRPGETQAGYSGYAGMKAGLVVASRYLARELAGRGIRVNTVSPGPTHTRISGDAFDRHPEIVAEIAAANPFGRVGAPEDIGSVIAFLVSQDARWITGQDILVAGGQAL